MVRDRDAAISHIIRQANDVLPCPPRGGWQRGHIHTQSYMYTCTYYTTNYNVAIRILNNIAQVGFAEILVPWPVS